MEDMVQMGRIYDIYVELHAELFAKCDKCGASWTLKSNGSFPPDWWQCPNGCNSESE